MGPVALGSLRSEDVGKPTAPPVLAIALELDMSRPDPAELAADYGASHSGFYEERSRYTAAAQGDSLTLKRPEPEITAQPKGKQKWNGKRLLLGLGRRDTAAFGGLLSTQSRPSPTNRGKGDDWGHEGKAS